MIIGIGTDITPINRIRSAIDRFGKKFTQKVYTDEEILYCEQKKHKFQSYAACFAVKEAISKAIGTGIGRHCKFHDIELLHNTQGKPSVKLLGPLQRKFADCNIFVSISHTDEIAIAQIIIEKVK